MTRPCSGRTAIATQFLAFRAKYLQAQLNQTIDSLNQQVSQAQQHLNSIDKQISQAFGRACSSARPGGPAQRPAEPANRRGERAEFSEAERE